MPSTFFVRVRGRVLGPFDQEKLRSLAARGQFGRMHEVSQDGVTWERASMHPELFKADAAQPATAAVAEPQATSTGATRAVEQSQENGSSLTSAAAGPGMWYYETGGNQTGPISFGQLSSLCLNGSIRATDRVWTQGMPQWVAARDVDGLIAFPATASSTSTAIGNSVQKLPDIVVSNLLEMRPWLILFAVLHCLASAGLLIGGVVYLILAAKASSVSAIAAPLAIGSFSSFVNCGLFSFTTYLLFSMIGRIRDCGYHRNEETLAAVLRTIKALVVFWGIVTVFGIVLGLIATIYLLVIV